MRYFEDYMTVVATKERSAGNESIGDMWTETKVFDKGKPIEEIIAWARDCSGKLILTIDERGAI